MAASSLFEKIGDFLECQICLDSFKKPKVLQCLHTFCEDCLSKMAGPDGSGQGTGTLLCPTCREKTVLQGQGVSDLKSNFVLANLLELVTSLQEPLPADSSRIIDGGTTYMCSNCDDGIAATSRCLNCCEFLCGDCASAHRRLKSLRHHVMRDITAWIAIGQQAFPDTPEEEMEHGMLSNACPSHSTTEVVYYCEPCELMVCEACAQMEHSKTPHRLATIVEAAERERQQVNVILSECKRKLCVFSTAIECTVQIAKDLQRRTDRAQKDIQTTVRDYLTALQNEQTQLMSQLHKKKEDKESEMAAHIDSLQRAVDVLRNICSLAENVLKNGSHLDVLRAKSQLTSRRHDLERISICNVSADLSLLKFERNANIDLADNLLGNIEDS
ncbi:E3 ubiquitin-protein ligase TRIM56-like [Amphiura filiformis]|uniref:E3 ubiquitin-protein ligase TRIM56-like n=1 Tax=Amphiura filiformis TaxID=82378 RepID=UPI003B20D486